MSEQRLSDAELAAIEARAEAAMPGPWTADHKYPMFVGTTHAVVIPGSGMVDCGRGKLYNQWLGQDCDLRSAENANFIAAARTDVPRLVVELRALRAENKRLRAALRVQRALWVEVGKGYEIEQSGLVLNLENIDRILGAECVEEWDA